MKPNFASTVGAALILLGIGTMSWMPTPTPSVICMALGFCCMWRGAQ